MLTDAIGGLLPSAVAVALSPVPIVAVVVMLGTPRARSNGPAFAAGWIAGLVVVSVIVLIVARGADDPDSATSTGIEWGKLVLGALLVVLAIRQLRKRPADGAAPEMPAWMSKVDTFDARRSFVVGAALSGANPKNLALTLAAAASIAQAGLSSGGTAIAVAVYVVVASSTVGGAVLFSMVAPGRASRPLASTRDFMARHSAVIMFVVLVVIGAKLIGDGIAGV